VIRPSGGQPPTGLTAAMGLATLGVFGVFSYNLLVISFSNMVRLTVEFNWVGFDLSAGADVNCFRRNLFGAFHFGKLVAGKEGGRK
jgi:hypothetical protein